MRTPETDGMQLRRAKGLNAPSAWEQAASLSVGTREPALQGPRVLLLKEVIQPHVPVRLPCYDFTPVADHTVVSALPRVRLPTSGATNFHGVTGGVYKTRERIHRDNADSRLLAIPTSRSRVADFDPDYDRLWGLAPPRGLATFCTGHCSTCVALPVRAMMT